MGRLVLQRLLLLKLLTILLVLLAASVYQAQDSSEASPQRLRIVGIISGRDLGTSAPSNISDDGISRLSEMFRSLGASVYTIPPNEEIPSHIELVVIVRPSRPMSTAQTAYLWDYLQNGGHMLLALDPIGHNRVSTESARSSGINRLLQTEYGISIVDDLLVEDWFGLDTLNDVVSSWSESHAENLVPHAITAPLIAYDLPIRYWGARSVFVDSVTGIANTSPLIYTELPYGETSRINYQDTETEQFLLNIGADSQGRLLLGGISTNLTTGSRVALVGDSEIFQNIYGQTRIAGQDNLPLYPGDYIFTQRLLAWLLAIPEAEWPELPSGFTWISLDGDLTDWPSSVAVLSDSQSSVPFYSLTQLRTFQNDQFVYLALETINPLPEGAAAVLTINDSSGNPITLQGTWDGSVYFQDELVPDAKAVFGSAVEMRLPRRLFANDTSLIVQACIQTSTGSALDCYDGEIQPVLMNEIDPVPLRFGAGSQAFILNEANLRQSPSAEGIIIVALPVRTPLAVFGRNEDGDWLFVKNGRYEGWVSSSLLELNAELEALPVLEEIEAEETPEATEIP